MAFDNIQFITSEIKESPKFIRTFSVADIPVKAVLKITGLGLYNAFINENKAGDAYLAPGSNDYDGYLRYQQIEVTDLVRKGDNKIEVLLGNGWYKSRFGLMPPQGLDKLEYLLAADLEIETQSGEKINITTDSSWYAEESCIRSNGIYDGEVRDDTFKADHRYACAPIDKHFNIIPEICPPVREKLTLKPQLIITPKGEKVLDFGQNMAGVVRFRNTLKAGERISLKFGEILIDECFCNTNYRSAVGGYTYISDGIEKDVEAMFTYFGFRYVLVETEADIIPDSFTAVVLYTDLKNTMQVDSSDKRLNRLLENSLWGQRSNFLDVPTDCPQRDERLGWTGDAQVFADTACFHMNCEAFYRKYLTDLRYDQVTYLNGDVPMFSPCMKSASPGGPAWADAATIIPWTVYEHYGNSEDLRNYYPMMRDYVKVLEGKDAADRGDHILTQGHAFGDWLAMDGATANAFKGGTDDTYVRTVYYWYSVSLAARAAAVIGETEDEKYFGRLAEEIKAAIRNEFFSPGGRLCIDTQTGYVLAVYFDLDVNREKTIEGFKRRLSLDRMRLKTGFVGTGFLLQALFKAGMEDYAYRMLFTEEFPGWFYAVNLGATTVWERWNSVMPDGSLSPTGMNSLNHYSYGAVAGAVYSCIAGLKCDEPGWKRAILAPCPNYRLGSISVSFDSPSGTWKSAWKINEDGSLSLSFEVPEGTSACIKLPYHPDKAEYEVEPGRYEYTYMPTVDFIYPYSGETTLCDVAADPSAVKALTEAVPGAFEDVFATFENNAASTLAGAIFFTPIPDLPQKIDSILRSVKYDLR